MLHLVAISNLFNDPMPFPAVAKLSSNICFFCPAVKASAATVASASGEGCACKLSMQIVCAYANQRDLHELQQLIELEEDANSICLANQSQPRP